jgi:hypothetical protein
VRKGIEMRRLIIFAGLFIFLFLIISNCVYASEEFNFAKSVIKSFQCNLIAKEKLISEKSVNAQKSDDPFIKLFNTMVALNRAVSWQEKAILEIEPYKSSNIDIIKKIAEGIIVGNKIIIESMHEHIALIKEMLNYKTNELESKMGTFMNKLSEITAKSDKGWDLIMTCAIGVCHVLVKKQGTLSITSNERIELMKELQLLGVKSGPRAGQKPIETAPCIIWAFLNEPGWKPIDNTQGLSPE